MPAQTGTRATLATRINNLVKDLLELINELKDEELILTRSVAAATSERADVRADLEREIKETKELLRELIMSKQAKLFLVGKRSFDTLYGSISLRDTAGSTKVVNGKELLALARKLGVVRKLFTMKISWTFSVTKFEQWVEKFPELAELFYQYLDVTTRHDKLSLKPHEPRVKAINLDRISSEAISPSNRASPGQLARPERVARPQPGLRHAHHLLTFYTIYANIDNGFISHGLVHD